MAEMDCADPCERASAARTAGRWTSLVLLIGVAVIGSNSFVLSPLLPDIARDFGADPVSVARAIAAYGGATAVSALLLAPLIDRYGVRRCFVAAGALMAMGLVGSALARSVLALGAAQAVAGLAAGLMLPAIYAAATRLDTEARGARTLGRVLIGWSISLVAGVPISALIAERFGWQAPFTVLAVVIALASVGSARMESVERPGAGGPPGGFAPFAVARLPTVPRLLGVQFCFMLAFFAAYAFLFDHLRGTLGLSAATAGLVVLAYGLGFGCAAFADGVVDRMGARRTLPPALAIVAATYFVMPAATWSVAGALAAAFVWGFANHFVVNVVVLLLGRAGGDRRGAALGLNTAVTYAGALVGPVAAGAAYSAFAFTGVALLAAAAGGLAALLAATGRSSPSTPPSASTSSAHVQPPPSVM